MRKPVLALLSLVTPWFMACSPQQAPPGVDPALGRACFAAKQPGLPPGSQYEGVAAATDDRLTIKVMNGVEVIRVDCALGPDGQIR